MAGQPVDLRGLPCSLAGGAANAGPVASRALAPGAAPPAFPLDTLEPYFHLQRRAQSDPSSHDTTARGCHRCRRGCRGPGGPGAYRRHYGGLADGRGGLRSVASGAGDLDDPGVSRAPSRHGQSHSGTARGLQRGTRDQHLSGHRRDAPHEGSRALWLDQAPAAPAARHPRHAEPGSVAARLSARVGAPQAPRHRAQLAGCGSTSAALVQSAGLARLPAGAPRHGTGV